MYIFVSYSCSILELATRWRWVVSLTPEEIARGSHCVGDWMGPRAGPDCAEEKYLLPLAGLKPGRPTHRYTGRDILAPLVSRMPLLMLRSDWLQAKRPRGRSSSLSRVKNCHFWISARPALELWGPIQWVPGALFPWVKRLGHEVDRSSPSSAEVKKSWVNISTPQYVFMA
jgi:hypothetical protein